MKRVILLLFLPMLSWASEEQSAPIYVDEPKSCFELHQFPCAIRFIQNSKKLESDQAQIFGMKGTSLLLNSPESLRLLEGLLFLESQKPIQIQLGVVNLQSTGEVLIEKSDTARVAISQFSGEAQVSAVFHQKKMQIPTGMSQWFSGTNQKGEMEMGVLSPVDFKKALPLWRDLTTYSKVVAKNKIQIYRQNWKEAVEVSANFYKEIVERRIASETEVRMQRERRLEMEKKEREKLRQLFRARQYLD